MKKLIFLSIICLFTVSVVHAQWTENTDGSTLETTQDVSIADGNVRLRDVGANRGAIDLFDQDNREYLRLYSSGGQGFLRMAGSNPRGMRFFPGNEERVFFAPSGRVGIGTDTPTSLLHVTGDITQTGTSLFVDNADKLNIVRNAAFSGSWQLTNEDEAEMFQMRNGAFAFFNTGSASAGSVVNWNRLMTITAEGNVGVGIANPASRLHVRGGYRQTSREFAVLNGNRFDLTRNAILDGNWTRSEEGTAQLLQMLDGEFRFSSGESAAADTEVNWSRLMTVKSDGKVGIGINSRCRCFTSQDLSCKVAPTFT